MWCDDEEFTAVKWRIINDYIRLEPVGPLIDGNLVLSGVTHSASIGPVLATVEFAADHEEEFSEVSRVMPWDMLLSAPEDDSSGAPFVVPVTLGADVEGTVRIIVFVDNVCNIPYDEDRKEGFNEASPSFIPSIMYVNRVGGSRRPEEAEVGGADASVHESRGVAREIRVAYGPADRERCEKENFELGAVVNIGSDGMSLINSTEFPFCLGVAHTEMSAGAIGIEDIIFVESESKDTMPIAPNGFDLVGDLSQASDARSTFLAVRSGPSPRFQKILMFICHEEGIDVADHFIENVIESLGGGVVRMAPNSLSQEFGARMGLLLVDGSNNSGFDPMPIGADEIPAAGPVENHASNEVKDDAELQHPGDGVKLPNTESMSFGEMSDDDFDDDEIDDDGDVIERLEQERRDLEIELMGARQANGDIQKRVAIVLAKSVGKDGAGGRGAGDADGADAAAAATTNLDGAAEKERHYKETMDLIAECNKRLKREQEEYEQQALDLQTRLDDKEYKAEEIAASLRQFKRYANADSNIDSTVF